MLRNPDRFRTYRLAGSFKLRKWAGCTIVTNAGPHSFWHLLRSPFMSPEALAWEIAEMCRRRVEKPKPLGPMVRTKTQAAPTRYFFRNCVFASILPPMNIGESQLNGDADYR